MESDGGVSYLVGKGMQICKRPEPSYGVPFFVGFSCRKCEEDAELECAQLCTTKPFTRKLKSGLVDGNPQTRTMLEGLCKGCQQKTKWLVSKAFAETFEKLKKLNQI